MELRNSGIERVKNSSITLNRAALRYSFERLLDFVCPDFLSSTFENLRVSVPQITFVFL
jgi:hypothetical protein